MCNTNRYLYTYTFYIFTQNANRMIEYFEGTEAKLRSKNGPLAIWQQEFCIHR